MKKIIHYTVLSFLLLTPVVVSCSDYRQPEPTGTWKKIYLFLKDNRVDDSYGKSWMLSKALRPVKMTAIAFLESGGTLNDVRGTCGEVSAFQILRPPPGMDKRDFLQSMYVAESIFNEKLLSWKNLQKATAAYNGNPKKKKPREYAQEIDQLETIISSYPS